MKTSLRSIVAVILLSTLQACSSASQQDAATRGVNNFSFARMGVNKTMPAANATNVPINAPIRIITSQPVDAYSANPLNFAIFDEFGNHIGAEKSVSSRYIPHPDNPSIPTSEIIIRLNQNLFPNRDYVVSWGNPKERPQQDGDIDPAILGIRGLNGAIMETGGFKFTTGSCTLGFGNSTNGEEAPVNCDFVNQRELEIVSISPGVEMDEGIVNNFTDTLSNILGEGRDSKYFTVAGRTDIRIRFSEPFVDEQHQAEINFNGLSPLAPMPIQDFSSLYVFVVDSSTVVEFQELWGSMLNIAVDENSSQADIAQAELIWNDFRDSTQALNGNVYSNSDRTELIFELAPGEFYPNTGGQAVIVLARRMQGYESGRPLSNDNFIAGFVNFTGFQDISQMAFDFGSFIPGLFF